MLVFNHLSSIPRLMIFGSYRNVYEGANSIDGCIRSISVTVFLLYRLSTQEQGTIFFNS